MSRGYLPLAVTPAVRAAQETYGSLRSQDRLTREHPAAIEESRDALGPAERSFVASQDGFYLATTSQAGWPYVQFRGGLPGFVRSPDEHTIAWADFRGNRQYLSVGNLEHDDRVAMIFLDQQHQTRLKVFGRAQIRDVHDSPAGSALGVAGYPGRIERDIYVDVVAFDWNCPQHIVPRYSIPELASLLKPTLRELDALKEENRRLRNELGS